MTSVPQRSSGSKPPAGKSGTTGSAAKTTSTTRPATTTGPRTTATPRATTTRPVTGPIRATAASKAAAVPQTRRERLESIKAAQSRRRKNPTFTDRLADIPGSVWTLIITGVVVIAIVGFAIFINNSGKAGSNGSGAQVTNNSPLAVGKKMPALPTQLKGGDGKSYVLDDYIGKKTVFLEFFAPWCPVCQAEAPTLNQLYSENQGKDIQFFSVSASPYGKNYEKSQFTDTTPISYEDVTWFTQNFTVPFPMLFDPQLKTVNAVGLNQGYPTLYIIDKTGKVSYVSSGGVAHDQLQSEINKALGNN